MDKKLHDALVHPLWLSHSIGDSYRMDGRGEWELYYYPILGDGQTQIPYDEPRALVKADRMFGNKLGMDLREVPLRYLERI